MKTYSNHETTLFIRYEESELLIKINKEMNNIKALLSLQDKEFIFNHHIEKIVLLVKNHIGHLRNEAMKDQTHLAEDMIFHSFNKINVYEVVAEIIDQISEEEETK